jgi:hypothetical protein
MFKFKNPVNLLILVILVQTFSFAEEKESWDFSVKMGLNVGGTMPFPMPATIEKIESYSPSLLPAIEAGATHWLGKKIGVYAAINLDNKGLKNEAKVKEYSMKFKDLDGRFTGMVENEMYFHYLRLPILAHYVLMENFSLYTGAYYAYLLKGEFKGATRDGTLNDRNSLVPIDYRTFDFSDGMRNYDAGFSAGLNYLPYDEHILLSFDFNYGLVPIFPSGFDGIAYDMQNIYGRFSIGYVF